MAIHRCVDIISVIIAEKIQEDQKTKEGGKNKSVADYTLRLVVPRVRI